MEERRGVYRLSVGKPEGKRPLGRLRCRWKDIGYGGMEWIELLRIDTGGGHLGMR
jgi:hypothetical protein